MIKLIADIFSFSKVERSIYPEGAENMKPNVVADEMFPEGAGPYMDLEEAGGSSVQLLMDLAANEKSVHADFFNEFDDLFDDEDLH
ncbi:COP9 signalosome complex subunit 9 [Chamberlinius hualienensis]